MITSNPCGFIYCSCNVAPAQALVLRLKSLKKGVRNKFLTPFNSHFLLFQVTATIKSTRFSVIIYKLLHKKKTFLSGRKVFGVEIRAGYLTSFGDERLEKFFSFFGVGEVEFGHFTEEFHAAVF